MPIKLCKRQYPSGDHNNELNSVEETSYAQE